MAFFRTLYLTLKHTPVKTGPYTHTHTEFTHTHTHRISFSSLKKNEWSLVPWLLYILIYIDTAITQIIPHPSRLGWLVGWLVFTPQRKWGWGQTSRPVYSPSDPSVIGLLIFTRVQLPIIQPSHGLYSPVIQSLQRLLPPVEKKEKNRSLLERIRTQTGSHRKIKYDPNKSGFKTKGVSGTSSHAC